MGAFSRTIDLLKWLFDLFRRKDVHAVLDGLIKTLESLDPEDWPRVVWAARVYRAIAVVLDEFAARAES